MLTFIGYFALGVVSDVIITIYYLAVASRRALRASALAIVIPLLSFAVIAQALETHDWTCILAFTLGNGAGTYWAVRKAR
jgi:hypothetical protein